MTPALVLALTVVLNGKPAVSVSVPPAAHPATRFAAETLTNMFCRLTGAQVPIVEGMADGTPLVRLDPAFAELAETDAYEVRPEGKGAVIRAGNPKGLLNGVHRWLECNTDIIWPRPKDDFTVCSVSPTLELKDYDYRDRPAFKLRYFGRGSNPLWNTRNACTVECGLLKATKRNAKWEREREEMRRLGAFETWYDQFTGGHNMLRAWFSPAEHFSEHPEYYMLVDGKRVDNANGNLCETNPEMVAAFTESVLKKIAMLPETCREVAILLQDNNQTCQCPNCMKDIVLADGTVVRNGDPDFKSTRFFLFFNQVARAVAKVRPNLVIRQYAYIHLSVPPRCLVEPNVKLMWCPYPRNMRGSVVEDPTNAKWKERLDGWLAKTPNLYFREYYFCGCIYYPRPMADTAAVDLRYIAAKGVPDVYTDAGVDADSTTRKSSAYHLTWPMSEFYDMVGVEAWTIQKLFWDPSLDPQMLRRTYLTRTFRESAAEMIEFYDLIRTGWYSDSLPSGWGDNACQSAARYIVKTGLSEKCRSALARAAAKAARPEQKAWIASMQAILERWNREAPNHVAGEAKCPLDEQVTFPDFDFEGTAWQKATRLPEFLLRNKKRTKDPQHGACWIKNDGRAFLFGFRLPKDPTTICVERQKSGKESFPNYDHVEFLLSHPTDGFYQFAFDPDGNRYEAKGSDATWSCAWELKTRRTDAGWEAVVRLPFASVGFEPTVNAKVRFLPLYMYRFPDKKKTVVSWGAGSTSTPASWGEIEAEF